MAGPKKVTQEEYDELRSKMEEKYDYDEMSDEEKERFDATMDQVAVVGDKTDETDESDATDDEEVEKGEFEDGYPQEHEFDDDKEIR
ncbi:hypothetical protein Q5O24_06870 [Eubacteriaceae bacterium ES3]|nr:hypothetical protein Q5O24_06870 [Eubacteriaceae bacterium ES3]